jgi:hypothetical protein
VNSNAEGRSEPTERETSAQELINNLLADDSDNHPLLRALIEGSPAQRFMDPTTIAVGVAALIALLSSFGQHLSGKS